MYPGCRSLIIPFFIPHKGCPHRCLFCNQTSITGCVPAELTASVVKATVNHWLTSSTRRDRVQVAFYGGSFTCLPRAEQERLLGLVEPFLGQGEIHGIRLSTRPDCVDAAVCAFLKARGVKTVELGIQSFDDDVLLAAQRGHTSADSLCAARWVRASGLELGLQLMPGLPGECSLSFLRGVRTAIALKPDFVRLYPVLVVENSGLAEMYRFGNYRPLSMNRAIAVTRRAKRMFEAADIRVVRIGLQPSTALEREIVAGPYHPAFGELVAAREWMQRMRAALACLPADKKLVMRIAERDLSACIGPRRANLRRIAELGMAPRLSIETDKEMKRGTCTYVVG